MDKVIQSSRDCVNWYAVNCKSATVDQLLDLKTKMVTNNYYLAEQLVDLKKEYNHAYYSRKIEFSKVKNGLIKSGLAVNKCDSQAIEDTQGILKAESELESTAYRLEQLIRHFGNISDDIMQRISVLKKETFNSNTQ